MDSGFVKSFVDKIVREYGTRDIFFISEKAGIAIIYESWHPLTIGEFERGKKTIFVNRNAMANAENSEDLEKKIIAHELGHFFAINLRLGKKEEEKFARLFAERILRDNG